MKIKRDYVITVFFLAFIFVFMISVVIRTLSVEGTENKLTLMREKASECMTDDILAKQYFLEFNGFISKICGAKINVSDNTIAEIDGGWLTYVYDYFDTSYQAKQLLKFNDFLKRHDIDFLTLILPFKIDSTDTDLMESLNDKTNKTADTFIENISSEADVFDMRNITGRHGKDYLEMFFRSDHHWKPETGLEFTAKAAEYLNDNYDFDIDVSAYNKEKFNVNVLENYFLGSQGRKVTKGYIHPENISIITPKEETDFSITIPKTGLDIRGNFEEAFIDKEQINRIDYYNLSPYSAYMHEDKPYIHIKNNLLYKEDKEYKKNSGEKKRILILKDSYANVMTPFLAMQTYEIDIIDLRYYNDNIRAFIEETNPDMVIMICHVASIVDKSFFKMD